jgi:hypothetical protein
MALKDILMLMVTAGADVNAIDFVGRSVTEVACLAGYEKLWMEVLGECGYDLAPVYESLNCFCESHTDAETEILATTLWNIGPDKLTFAEYSQHREMQRRVWIAEQENETYTDLLKRDFWSIDDIYHRQQLVDSGVARRLWIEILWPLIEDEICREDKRNEWWKCLFARAKLREKSSHYIGTGMSTYSRILREINYDLPPSRGYNYTWTLVKSAFYEASWAISHFKSEGSDSGESLSEGSDSGGS